ncbi:hypothetical protein GDO78_018840 [Eleutherodactylus coqui]|uniref:Uncharacterized protein n=1 Tax=Eleutherodactylus coqui TaxID=57060 RepID=A0A8J6EP92_ELECQ|nr:hypothetical protein GDO78_018840 [Eleutherodactylus coqui]
MLPLGLISMSVSGSMGRIPPCPRHEDVNYQSGCVRVVCPLLCACGQALWHVGEPIGGHALSTCAMQIFFFNFLRDPQHTRSDTSGCAAERTASIDLNGSRPGGVHGKMEHAAICFPDGKVQKINSHALIKLPMIVYRQLELWIICLGAPRGSRNSNPTGT